METISSIVNILSTVVLTPIIMLAEWAGGLLGWDPYPLVDALTKPGFIWLRDLLYWLQGILGF